MPSATFISYAWDSPVEKNESWVMQLAARLKQDGVDIKLDKWCVQPGDPIAPFMQKAIAQSNKILIICTPDYKAKADDEKGSVGYEHNIISAQIWLTADHRKFITILKEGNDLTSVPTGLQGKYHIRLNDPSIFEAQYQLLLQSIPGTGAVDAESAPGSTPPALLPTVQKDYSNLSFATMRNMSKQEIREYIDHYRRQLDNNRNNARAYFGIGLCYLHSGLYDIACRQLGKAVRLSPQLAEYHYYYALALCRGIQPGHLPYNEIMDILKSLECALALDSGQAKYYCFLLLLHLEYFNPAGSRLPAWDMEEVLQKSRAAYRDEDEIERLTAALNIKNAKSLKLLFN